MAQPGPANDAERLPWIEPYQESKVVRLAPVKPRSRNRSIAALAALAVLVAAGAGYILGQDEAEPGATPPDRAAIVPIVPPRAPTLQVPADAEPGETEALAASDPDTAAAIAPPKAEPRLASEDRVVPVVPDRVEQPDIGQGLTPRARIEVARIRASHAAESRRAQPAPPPAYRVWPKMPSPGPAGQVIQLGAFSDQIRANAALRQRVARYPALGRMPRYILPVITKPSGQILYVLRLGTTSRQQSTIVCRNLRASGDHCLVIG